MNLRFKRTQCRCKECPLDGQKKVLGIANFEKPKIAIIGEAPGQNEDSEGMPFVGAAGAKLKEACASAGLVWHTTYKTNVVLCRPPNNEIDSVEGKMARECCLPGFKEEVKWMESQGFKVLVPTGNTALGALGLEGKIGKARGSVYQVGKMVAVPTFHPSFILRGMWKEEPTWIADLIKAKDLSLKKWKPPKENFNLFPTVKDVTSFVTECLEKKLLVGVDIETTSLNEFYSKIIVIGLAKSGEDVITVPFYKQGGVPYWSMKDEIVVKRELKRLFEKGRLVFQNAPFDTRHLEKHGFPVPNVAEDTMLLHHCITGDTEVDTLEWGRKPISELSGMSGFHVVSWDGKKLVPGRVRKCWSSGVRSDLVRVTFWNKDRIDKTKMWIDCTADHEFPVQGLGKIPAGDLQPGMRLVRGQVNTGMIEKRVIHRWVWESLNGPLGSLHVHHKDGNHKNNSPDNLLAVTVSEHNKYHKDVQYRATMVMTRNAKQRREERADVEAVKKLYYDVGLSYREVASELNCADHLVVSILKHDPRGLRKRGDATKLRWEKSRNCRVISVTPLGDTLGVQEVFDMEVEKTHYFSANGVIVSNCINPELPHNLGYIVSIYGDTPYWKDVVLGSEDKMINMDDEILRTYNARDSAVLLQVLPNMYKHLKEVGTERTYREVSLKLVRPLRRMSQIGLPIDKKRMASKRASLLRKTKMAEAKLREICELPASFNLNSGDHLRLLLWGQKPKAAARVMAEKAEIDGNLKKRKDTKKYKDLLERIDVYENTKPLYKTWATMRSTEAGSIAVDSEALLAIERAALGRYEAMNDLLRKGEKWEAERKEIEKLLTFLKEYRKYAEAEKLASTFTGFPIAPDGRVHPSYKIHGTATGRLSSSDINAQNIPSEVQDVFVAPEGYQIIKADYSNIELRVLAYITGEKLLIDTFESGKNIHDTNCKLLFGIDEKHPMWKEARRAAKVYVFGRSYGGGINGIYEQIITAVPDLRLSFEHFKEMDHRYFQELSKYREWVQKQQKQARNTRCIETAFGRKRFLLGTPDEIERMALNTPIQGTAGEVALNAIIELDEKLEKKFPNARMITTVHDSILVQCPTGDVQAVSAIMKQVMEREYTIEGRKVRFPVDIEVGPSWGETKPIQEWQSTTTKKKKGSK